MYKDVGKKIVAAMLCVCMLMGMLHVSNLSAQADAEQTVAGQSEDSMPNGESAPTALEGVQPLADTIDLKDAGLTVEPRLYDGQSHQPEVKYNGETLTVGTDIASIDWGSETEFKNAGTYTATIKATSTSTRFTPDSEATVEYTIMPKSLYNALMEYKTVEIYCPKTVVVGTLLDDDDKVNEYLKITDKAISPGTPLKGTEKGKYDKLLEDSDPEAKTYDYTYEIKGNTETINREVAFIIRGCNNYTNGRDDNTNKEYDISASMRVTGKAFTVEHTTEKYYYDGNSIAETIKNELKNSKVVDAVDSTPLSPNKDDSEDAVDAYEVLFYTADGTTPLKESQVVDPGVYRFTVRGCEGGTYEGYESPSFSFTIVKKLDHTDISFGKSDKEVYFAEEVIKPFVEVYDKNTLLSPDADYVVIPGGTLKFGDDYALMITGRGFYEGTIYRYVKIKAIPLEQAIIKVLDESIVYDAWEKKQEPAVEVTFFHPTLQKTIDITKYCDVSYDNNLNAGKADVKISPKSGVECVTGEKSGNFTIEPRTIGDADVTVEVSDFTYDGNVQKPEVTVIVDGKTLDEGADKDYILTINDYKDAVEGATITVKGVNNYQGTVEKYYNINARDISQEADVTVVDRNYPYTGQLVEPEVTVYLGKEKLTEGTDYNVTPVEGYENINAGPGAVEIVFTRNYKGSVIRTFTISQVDIGADPLIQPWLDDVDKAISVPYKGQDWKPAIHINHLPNKGPLTEGVDYTEPVYSNNLNATNGGDEATVTVTGHGNYTGTLTLKFTINPQRLTKSNVTAHLLNYKESGSDVETPFEETEQGYNSNGEPVIPTEPMNVRCKDISDVPLIKDTDYTVEYKDNKAIGTGTMEITGKGNYYGTVSFTFQIKGNLGDTNVTRFDLLTKEIQYTGFPIKLGAEDFEGTYMQNNRRLPLTLDKDFVLEYNPADENERIEVNSEGDDPIKEKREMTVTVKAKDGGDYTGTYGDIKYYIVKRDISKVAPEDLIVTVDSIPCTGNPVTEDMLTAKVIYKSTSEDGETKSIPLDPNEYTIEYKNTEYKDKAPSARGTYDVIIKINDAVSRNFTGSVERKFEISPLMIRQEDLDVNGTLTTNVDDLAKQIPLADEGSVHFTDEQIEGLKIEYSNQLLTLGRDDYEVFQSESGYSRIGYDEEENYLRIVFKNNFGGEIKVPFRVYGDFAKGWNEGKGNAVKIATEFDREPYRNGNPYYTGKQIELKDLKVTYLGKELEKDVDYTLSYSDSTSWTDVTGSGTPPTITITGVAGSDYLTTTSATKSFEIQRVPLDVAYYDLQTLKVNWDPKWDTGAGMVYNMKAWEPVASFTDESGKNLFERSGQSTVEKGGQIYSNDNFIVTYYNNINGGKADDVDEEGNHTGPYVIIEATPENPNYSGEVEVGFTIKGVDLSKYIVEAVLPETERAFTGDPQVIKPIVKITGVDESQPDWKNVPTNYPTEPLDENAIQVNYYDSKGEKDCTNAGEVTVEIEGIGNFSGTWEKKLSYTIKPKEFKWTDRGNRFDLEWGDAGYTGKPMTATIITFTDKERDSSGASKAAMFDFMDALGVAVDSDNYPMDPEKDYIIEGANTEKGENYLSDIKAIEQGNYKFIDANGKDVTWPLLYNITAGNLQGAEVTGPADHTYTGSKIDIKSKDVEVKLSGERVPPDAYKVECTDINAGVATVTITAVGANYTGECEAQFQIMQKSLKDEDIIVEMDERQVMGSSGIVTPEPHVHFINEKKVDIILEKDKDYILTYENNKSVNNAAVVVIKALPGGNYVEGEEIRRTFMIVQDIKNVQWSPVPDWSVEKGIPAQPKPVLTDSGLALKENENYTLTWENNTAPGKAFIVVTGIGTYGGELRIPFTIYKNIDNFGDVIEVSELASRMYTGEEINDNYPMVTLDGELLTRDEDYTVTFTNNKNVGTAQVTIEGMGIYSGSKIVTFEITPRTLADCDVKLNNNNEGVTPTVIYEGSDLTPSVSVTYNGMTLVNGTDYKLLYLNNEKPGEGRVIVSGMGNYGGSWMRPFKIDLKPVSGVSAKAESSKKVTLSWSSNSAASGYEIYEGSTCIARLTSNTKTSYTITGLTAGSTHTYRVRAYVVKGGQDTASAFQTVTVKTP